MSIVFGGAHAMMHERQPRSLQHVQQLPAVVVAAAAALAASPCLDPSQLHVLCEIRLVLAHTPARAHLPRASLTGQTHLTPSIQACVRTPAEAARSERFRHERELAAGGRSDGEKARPRARRNAAGAVRSIARKHCLCVERRVHTFVFNRSRNS